MRDAIFLNRSRVLVNLRSSPPAVPASLDPRHSTRAVETPTLKLGVALAVMLSLVLAISLVRNVHYLKNLNGYQNAVARLAESILAPEDRYFDSIGMIVTRRSATRGVVGRRQAPVVRRSDGVGRYTSFGTDSASRAQAVDCELRVDRLWPHLRPHLETSYVSVWPNLVVSGARVSGSGSVTFRNYWPGVYTVYHSSGAESSAWVRFDGKPIEGRVRLEAGSYRLSLEEAGPAV